MKATNQNNEFHQVFERANLELHPDSPMPIYYQLSRLFIKLIQDGLFEPGTRFPTEESIASYYQVSRPTANKAMHILLQEGWVTRDKQDKRSGTYVKEKPYVSLGFLSAGMSFKDQFPEDVPIRSENIWVRREPATAKAAKILNLEEGTRVIHMRRLRFAFDQPIMVCDSQLPEARFPDLDPLDFVNNSLYTTLRERYDCLIVRSERFAEAVEAVDPDVVRLLNVDPFTSIMMITGISYSSDDEPIDFFQTYLQPGVSLKSTIQR
ncbi:MAG: GntR family transcriptional regulator [Anaerolineales bacterium]|jgi:GntR family transcriptional regulator